MYEIPHDLLKTEFITLPKNLEQKHAMSIEQSVSSVNP